MAIIEVEPIGTPEMFADPSVLLSTNLRRLAPLCASTDEQRMCLTFGIEQKSLAPLDPILSNTLSAQLRNVGVRIGKDFVDTTAEAAASVSRFGSKSLDTISPAIGPNEIAVVFRAPATDKLLNFSRVPFKNGVSSRCVVTITCGLMLTGSHPPLYITDGWSELHLQKAIVDWLGGVDRTGGILCRLNGRNVVASGGVSDRVGLMLPASWAAHAVELPEELKTEGGAKFGADAPWAGEPPNFTAPTVDDIARRAVE